MLGEVFERAGVTEDWIAEQSGKHSPAEVSILGFFKWANETMREAEERVKNREPAISDDDRRGYRVAVVHRPNGDSAYFPQRKGWLFWHGLRKGLFDRGGKSHFTYKVECESLMEARDEIDEDIRKRRREQPPAAETYYFKEL